MNKALQQCSKFTEVDLGVGTFHSYEEDRSNDFFYVKSWNFLQGVHQTPCYFLDVVIQYCGNISTSGTYMIIILIMNKLSLAKKLKFVSVSPQTIFCFKTPLKSKYYFMSSLKSKIEIIFDSL